MITPINTNWFQDATWTALDSTTQSAQTAYNTAKSAADASYTTYTAAENDLIIGINTPGITAAQLQTKKNTFDTAKNDYETKLATLRDKSEALLTAKAAEQTYVDNTGKTALSSYVTTLQSVDPTLTTALTGLTNARNAFMSQLTTFRTAQKNLTESSVLVIDDFDIYLDALATQRIAQLSGGSTPAQDQAVIDAFNAYSAQTDDFNSKLSTRDQAKAVLTANMNTYLNFLNNLVSEFQNTETIATSVIDAFKALQTEAQTLYDQSLADAQAADLAAQAQHAIDFPSTVDTSIPPAAALLLSNTALGAGLDTVTSVTSDISFPQIPAGGTLSINDLMRIVSLVQRFITLLSRTSQQADRNLDELRLKIWTYQGSGLVDVSSLLSRWAQIVKDADTAYDLQVASNNIANSQGIVDALNYLIAHKSDINAIIDQFNLKIDTMNNNVTNAANALQNSSFIATDIVNQSGTMIPDNISIGNVAKLDTTPVTYPATVPDTTYPAPPAPLAHLAHLTITSSSIPSSFPLVLADPGQPLSINNLPVNPSATDITTLNNLIDNINKTLFPIKSELLAGGDPPITPIVNYSFIDPFFKQTSIPVRDVSDPVANASLAAVITLLYGLVKHHEREREILNFENTGTPPPSFKVIAPLPQPDTTKSFKTSTSTGAGVGILGADTLSAQSEVGRAVQVVLSSQSTLNDIEALLNQAGILGGLAAITKLPTRVLNYSQLGVVRSDLGDDQAQAIEDQITAVHQDATTAAQHTTVSSLLDLVGNTDQLKLTALNLLSKLPPEQLKELSKEDIQKLLALLIALLKLLVLLVAALLAAAVGGQTNIDNIVATIFPQADEARAQNLLSDLKLLGVNLQITASPSAPGFEETLINALVPKLTPTQSQSLAQNLTQIFQSKGITLPTVTPLGTAVEQALTLAPLPVRPDLREAVREVVLQTGEELRDQVLSDEAKGATLATELNREILATLQKASPPQVTAIQTALNTSAAFVALNTAQQNIFIAAILNGQLTTAQAKTLIDQGVQNLIGKEIAEEVAAVTPLPQGLAPADLTVFALARAIGAISRPQQTQLVTDQLLRQALQVSPTVADLLRTALPKVTTPLPTAVEPQPVATPFVPPVTPTLVTTPPLPQEVVRTAPVATTPTFTPTTTTPITTQETPVVAPPVTPLVTPLVAPLVTPLEPQSSSLSQAITRGAASIGAVIAGISTARQVTSPSTLPKDAIALLGDNAKAISLQNTDIRVAREIAHELARDTRDQTDFFHRSINLLLDPAKVFIRNFSIFTQGSDKREPPPPLILNV